MTSHAATPLPRVDILLATYNGASWLPELLASLRDQSYQAWRLIVGDDGSTDGTLEILAQAAATDPGRIRLLPAAAERLGPRGNFARLCAESDAPYAMLCDQDDVWLPEKIEVTLGRMLAVESRESAERPVLVHTDLCVVDANLATIHESLWRYQRLDPQLTQPRRLVVQNHVTGCSAMMNQALLRLALPIPDEALMHDWWLALVASVHGCISAIDRATVLYRQHGGNNLGAKRWSLRLILDRALHPREARRVLLLVQGQSRAFFSRFAATLSPTDRHLFADVSALHERGWLARRGVVARHGVWKAGIARNVGMLVYL
jgi:glycosyltransferase involved in cell wall biosynthesis